MPKKKEKPKQQQARSEANSGLGEEIRTRRISSNLTQRQLAEKLGVSQPTVHNWEAGRTSPSEEQVEALGRVLGSLVDAKEPSVSGIGQWLASARAKRGWTLAELAHKAGLSTPGVWAIESGRSSSPRSSTLKKLEEALGEKVPAEAATMASVDAEIEGLGPLTDFDPHVLAERPTAAGVYVFYDVSERPVYVGRAGSIAKRIKDHEEKFWFKRPVVQMAAYVEIPNDELRHQVEQVLIKFLKSNAVLNKQSVDRE